MEELVKLITAGFSRIISELRGQNLGEGRQRRFQVIDVTVPAGSTAGIPFEVSIQLDRAYNQIKGIAYFEVEDGGIPQDYNVGARSNKLTWIDDINVNAWDANQNVGPNFKYYSVSIGYGSGDTWYARVTPNTAPATDLVGQMVLILEKSLTELPN